MARKKKAWSSRSSPISLVSEQSDSRPPSLNPINGGCSGNAGSGNGGRRVEDEEEVKKEE